MESKWYLVQANGIYWGPKNQNFKGESPPKRASY